jgi:transposase
VKPTPAVAGIDPHKHTATIALVDLRGGLHETASFPVTPDGVGDLLAFLVGSELVIDRIGVEGSGGLGRPLVLALTSAGYDVREVQPNRTAERRRRRKRAKTDIDDAEAIARETLADPALPPAGKHHAPDPAWEQLRVISDWRASLILQRVRLLNEAEAVLVSLPVALRAVLPSTSRVLPQLNALASMNFGQDLPRAEELKIERLEAALADITTLNRRIKDLDTQILPLLAELGSTLTEIRGVGVVSAMQLLVQIGDPRRFPTEAQFARWCGSAPVALSSGEGHGPARRHRLDLGGNRNVNSILHTVHITQIRCHPPAKAYMAKKIGENKTKREARRAHKRQLANVIIRHMWRDDQNRRRRHAPTPSTAT